MILYHLAFHDNKGKQPKEIFLENRPTTNVNEYYLKQCRPKKIARSLITAYHTKNIFASLDDLTS